MKVWITKYALTSGIFEADGDVSDYEPSLFYYHRSNWHMGECAHGEGRDWHRTREGAIDRAREMLAHKISSLRKQIAKLEKMEFK